MTDQRVPTEAEWRLVAGVMDLADRVNQHGAIICFDGHVFDPLSKADDLDALVQAMQAADYQVDVSHRRDKTVRCIVWPPSGKNPYKLCHSLDGRYATTFAIIDALAAEAERKEEENRDG